MTLSLGRAGVLLGTLYVVGIIMILISPWSPLSAGSVPWGVLVLAIGGLVMGASVAAGYSVADRENKICILVGIGGILAVLAMLIWQEGWVEQILAIGFVLLPVPVGVILKISLRRLS